MRRWIAAGALTLSAVAQAQGPDSTPARDTQPVRRLIPVSTMAERPPRFPYQQAPTVSTLTLSPGNGAFATPPLLGEGDLLRVVQFLPGVMARNDFNVGYNVRGGESDQNLILLDGIPLYNPFHVGGVFGTFIDAAVGDAAFTSGAIPARYGGRLSSVLDVTSAEDPRVGMHGTVGLSLLASHAVLGGALSGWRGAWEVAARRTYADKIVPRVSRRTLPYHFYDTQLHAVDTLPTGTRVAVTAYRGTDVLDGTAAQVDLFNHPVDSAHAGDGHVHFDWGNWVAGLMLSQRLRSDGGIGGDSVDVVQRGYVSHFGTLLDVGDVQQQVRNRVADAGLMGAVTRYATRHTLTVGYEYSHLGVHFLAPAQPTDLGFTTRDQTLTATALFVDDVWRLSDRLLLRPGLRLEHVGGVPWTGLSPRLSLRYLVRDGVALTLGGGRYTQWMHSLLKEDEPVRIFDYWVASDHNIPVSIGRDLVAGVELWPNARRHVRLELFHKRYGDLAEANPSADPADAAHAFLRVSGVSRGADILLQQLSTGPYSGWVSYTYAVSRRSDGTMQYPPAQDRRHQIDAVAQYHTHARWTLSAHFGLGSGTPYTDVVGEVANRFYDPSSNVWNPSVAPISFEPVNGPRNGARYPLYQRLDLSASKSYHVRGAAITPSLEVINAYNYHNVFTYDFNFTASPPTRTAMSQFPLFPAIGVTVSF